MNRTKLILIKSLIRFLSKSFSKCVVAASLVVLATSSATEQKPLSVGSNAHCDFFPPNNLRFPIIRGSSQMTEMDFNNMLKVIQQTYAPIFLQYGFGKFQIQPNWADETVNAFADVIPVADGSGQQVPVRFIHMFGGLARHPLMTREGFLLVACHEIGHHLGGYPRVESETWASDEGEADYYSTTKCARIVLGQLNTNLTWLQNAKVDFEVRTQCNASFANDQTKAAICMRSSMGGLALARVLASLGGNPNVAFATPDKSVIAQTYDGHPQAQCRLDTYFQGAICQKSEWERFGSGPGFGACEANFTKRGTRPACWYHDPIPRSLVPAI